MAETEIGNLGVKISLDHAALSRQLKIVQNEFKEAGHKLGDFGKTTEGLKLRSDSLTKQLDIQRQRVLALENAVKKSTEVKGADAKATQLLEVNLSKAKAQMAATEAELKKVTAELDKQTSVWHKVSTACENVGKKMQDVGKDLTKKVTAPLVALGVGAAKSAIDLESAFAGVRKTVDATEEEFAKLYQGFTDMGKEIPIATTGLMRIGEAAGQLGIETESILGFTDVMAKLGTATNMSADEAATALARLGNITQMSQDQYDRLGSTVVALGNSLATTESEIVEMGLRLAGAGSVAGMTEAEILSFAGALSSVGIAAEAGGTAFSRVMLEINNEVAVGGAKLQTFAAAAGMTAEEFAEHWKTAPAEALQAFVNGLGKMRDSGENIVPVLEELGLNEIRVRDALLRASGASDVFTDALETGTRAWEENTALTKEAEERFKTTAGKLQILKNQLQVVGAIFGEILLPPIIKVTEKIAGLLDRLSGMEEGTRKIIVTIAGVAAAIGPVLWGIGTLLAQAPKIKLAIAGIATAVKALGAAMAWLATNPIGLVITAIGALVAASVLIYKNWDTVKHYGLQAWGYLKVGVLKAIDAIAGAYEKLYGWVPVLGDKIRDAHAKVRAAIEAEQGILSERAGEWAKSTKLKEAMKEPGKDMWQLKDEIKETAEATKDLGHTLDDIVPDFDALGTAASSAGDKTKSAAEKIKTAWIGTTEAIKSALSLLRTQHETEMTYAEMAGDKVETMRLKHKQLSEELEAQKAIVAAARSELEKATAAGVQEGETKEDLAKRIDELNKKLAEEEKAQANLEKQIHDTSETIKAQGKSAKDLVSELKKVADTYYTDLAKALEDYQKKVKDTNEALRKDTEALQRDLDARLTDIAAKGAERERQVTEQYKRELEGRTRALMNFVGLFDAVTKKEVSGEALLRNLEGQVEAFDDWQENIQKLAARGIDKGLLEELRGMGPKAAPEIAALNALTDEQLTQYAALWKQKQEQARKEATAQLEQQRDEMNRQLAEIRADTANQLEQQRQEIAQKLAEMQAKAKEELEKYRIEWEKKNEEIRKNTEENVKDIHGRFNDLVGKSTDYGVSLIENFMDGIDSQMPALISKLESIAAMIDSYMPHSPAKRGPLKRIGEWGPAIIQELTEGIKRNLPNLENLTSRMALLSPGALQPAVANSYSTSNVNYSYGGNTIHITVQDGEDLLRTLHRLGVRLP